jgi:hypothetical protein
MALDYNHEHGNFDRFIGEVLWGPNYKKLGKIVDVEYFMDGYHHEVAMAVLDNGRRVNCRLLVDGGE